MGNSVEVIVKTDSRLRANGANVVVEEVVPHATVPRTVPKRAALSDARLYFNRELSWLDFNWRVLYQAMDDRTPLLERVRFISITSNNLDEFFRKRVGGLKRQVAAGVQKLSPDGRTPRDQLDLCRPAVLAMSQKISEVWEETLKPLLAKKAGIRIFQYDELTNGQKQWLKDYFQTHIFPVLTPLAVDPGHPFPFISNLSLSLAVLLKHPKRDTEHFARLKVPSNQERWIKLEDAGGYISLDQVIANNISDLFRGMDIVNVQAFRITRNADLLRDDEEADDLIEMISDELRERRFAPIVRLEVQQNMPREVRLLLMRELSLTDEDVYEVNGDLDLTHVSFFAGLDSPEHLFPRWEPVTPARLLHEGESKDRANIFEVIRNGDILVHHPYESFGASTQRFIEEAAVDPKVLAIKQTLYRTSNKSPIVQALRKAAELGKQVAVLVEVKARFDEKNNIEWGQILEKSGVHVTYGLVGLKTHTKTTLVIRQEEDELRAYCHVGTGNYNPATARLYTDFGLLTCSPDVGYDVINLFHYLTGYAPEQHYRRMIIAPRDMRSSFIQLVRKEVDWQKENGTGRIIAKMNALDDLEMIRELYRASEAGVRIDLIIRGHCRLRPGLPRFSENIRLVSIIGQFLEHSRVYYFRNNDSPRVFIGSADWQRRNLDDRVEAIVEIDQPSLKARLIQTLQIALDDPHSAWELKPDGRYLLRRSADGQTRKGFQETLMDRAKARFAQEDSPWDIE
ncbi:MAG: polyphosphate kinase 1 [Bacteroidetes bacterium]|nr:MAG: polyphosphate kinase 1 [Bacteroidota bacterium]